MLGIIGGTGVYGIDKLQVTETLDISTPFGKPSAALIAGYLGSQEVIFLPRHGINHELLPGEVNYRANIFALKKAGVTRVLGISAVGSLNPNLAMGDFVVPNQYFDHTKGIRKHTFFGNGLVAHVSTAHPVCPHLSQLLAAAGEKIGIKLQTEITYACVEGPRLGTKAESLYLKDVVGCDVVGMTNIPEVFLAREAQLCYATIAVITDYDCWLDDPEEHASVAQVFETYGRSIIKVKKLLAALLESPDPEPDCECRTSLKYALVSPEDSLNPDQKTLLKVLTC
ncbi:MAG: S-methyl-5'-thioadenosine phosphorylase [FCB group bacterium]|nr:S-methyl-5'-thioadenosine phosphorylase [FCB group bacterium]